MALLYFDRQQVDWAVIETGLGGAIDSTNVILPEVAVITNVAMDHMDYLGNTIAEIATVKAGIIKDHVPVVTGIQDPIALEAVSYTHLINRWVGPRGRRWISRSTLNESFRCGIN